MRIVHVLDHSLPESSGYSLRSHSIILEQGKRGWSTWQVTSSKQPRGSIRVDKIDGVEYIRTASTRPSWADRTPVEFFWNVRDLRAQLRRIVDRVKPDVLHAHSPCGNGLAALGLGVPVVYEMRTLWEDGSILAGRMIEGSLAHRVARALETYVVRRADAVVVISSGLHAEVIARGVPDDRVTVIANAVDSAMLVDSPRRDRQSVRHQFSLSARYVLGYVGSLFAWEGLDLLLRALSDLRARGLDVGLLIVGGGPDETILREAAEHLGIASHVVFAGRVSHSIAIDAYEAIDVLVYPRLPMRLTEIVTPLKPLEAMARGKAQVASDVGGHRELITDGVTGVLFPAGDAKALADAVLRVLRDPILASRLRGNGPRHVSEARTWTRSVAGYDLVYRRLVAGGAA